MTRGATIPDTVTLHVPFRVVKRGGRKEMRLPEGAPQSRRTDSTLVKALAGVVPTFGGTVRLGGADITGLPSHRLAAAGLGAQGLGLGTGLVGGAGAGGRRDGEGDERHDRGDDGGPGADVGDDRPEEAEASGLGLATARALASPRPIPTPRTSPRLRSASAFRRPGSMR